MLTAAYKVEEVRAVTGDFDERRGEILGRILYGSDAGRVEETFDYVVVFPFSRTRDTRLTRALSKKV